MPTSNVRLSDDSYEDLTRLKAAIKAEYGLTARNEDIASALISGATAPQTAGMLIDYQRKQAAVEAAKNPAP